MLPAILILTFAVFAPTLNDWFMGDDFWFLRASQTTPTGEYIVEAFDFRDLEPVPQFGLYRLMYVISFRLCYAVFGLNAWGYHAVNVGLHVCSVALFWLIARRVTGSGLMANAASLLFALHPAYTETIAVVSRGNTLMVTFVYLSTLLLFMKHLDGAPRQWLFYAGALAGFVLAVLYHTTALTLVVVLPAYAFLVAWKPERLLSARAWIRFAPFLMVALAMMAIQTSDSVGLDRVYQIGWDQYTRYGQYLGLALFPMLPGDWMKLDLPRLSLLFRLHQLGSLLMIAITLFLIDRRRRPYAGVFATVWLYATLAPNSAFLPLPLIGAAPFHLYLPGTALALFLVLAARTAGEEVPSRIVRPATFALGIVAAGVLASYVALSLHHEQQVGAITSEHRRFLTELRASVGALEQDGTVFVVNPPVYLIFFNDNGLIAAIQVYYGDVRVMRIAPDEVATVRQRLKENERIFEFTPSTAGRLPRFD